MNWGSIDLLFWSPVDNLRMHCHEKALNGVGHCCDCFSIAKQPRFYNIENPFEFYIQHINPAVVIDVTTIVDGTISDSLSEYVTSKTAYYRYAVILPNSPFEDSFRLEDIFDIYTFISDFASASELELSTILLFGTGILGLLTHRKKQLL